MRSGRRSSTSLGEQKARATTLIQQGRFGEARKLCYKLCKANGQDAEGWFLLGAVSGQLGDFVEAEKYCQRSLQLYPGNPLVLFNLAIAQQRLGKLAQAEENFRRVISVKADFAQAYLELGNIMHAQGKPDQAMAQYRRCLDFNPGIAQAHYNMACLLEASGQATEAMSGFRAALQCQPELADAQYRLGNLIYDKGDYKQAIVCYQYVLNINEKHPQAANNLGNALRMEGRLEDAAQAYQKAVNLSPDYVEAHNNLGNLLMDLGRLDDSFAALQSAVRLSGDFPEVNFNFARVLQAKGRLGEAEQYYRKALLSRPIAKAANNLGNLLVSQGRVDEALDAYTQAFSIEPDYREAYSNYLFCLNYREAWNSQRVFREHAGWGERYCQGIQAGQAGVSRDTARQLRVGYVSPDFKEHSVAFFFEALLSNHDPGRIHTVCYSNVMRADSVTARFRSLATQWRDISRSSDDEVVDLIRSDRIDILVDLAGHTSGNRLAVFCSKPAPIQFTYLGYPNTTGLSAIDYRLTDPYADPEGTSERYSEKLLRLPGCFLGYTPPAVGEDIPVGNLPAAEAGYVTFGSFNNMAKMNSRVVALWSQILGSLPVSRLVLKNKALADKGVRDRYTAMFGEHGVDADRIEYIAWTDSIRDHLGLYQGIDIALDTFPYNGTTTTCEALWMGVPVIALRGENHAGRVGASLLPAAGFPDFVADDESGYRDIAVALADDSERLGALRKGLRQSVLTSPLCDGKCIANSIEQCYRQVWRAWCEES